MSPQQHGACWTLLAVRIRSAPGPHWHRAVCIMMHYSFWRQEKETETGIGTGTGRGGEGGRGGMREDARARAHAPSMNLQPAPLNLSHLSARTHCYYCNFLTPIPQDVLSHASHRPKMRVPARAKTLAREEQSMQSSQTQLESHALGQLVWKSLSTHQQSAETARSLYRSCIRRHI